MNEAAKGVMAGRASLADAAAELLRRLKDRAPAVHCITNEVAASITANVLLAVGARPSMTTHAAEVAEFIGGADALLVNLGTLNPARREAIALAVDGALEKPLPWVIDPVFVDRSPGRLDYALALMLRRPAAVRGNGREMRALARETAVEGDVVLVETGHRDRISASGRTLVIDNGHPLFAQVVGAGCALSALVAAALAVGGDDRMAAAAAAVLAFGVAGEVAAERAQGPGTFAAHLLDVLAALDPRSLKERARVAEG